MVLDRLSLPDVERLARRVGARRGESDSTLRPWVARELFDLWNETTNPELLSAQWNSLNGEDRRYWLRLAGELLDRLRKGD
ncbi:MAG: hypothetical protein E6Q56_01670 [Mycobacterium sp.]|nr:MAG: hypothetical protein E6Q56_01670 [Mycobacterium sp.]